MPEDCLLSETFVPFFFEFLGLIALVPLDCEGRLLRLVATGINLSPVSESALDVVSCCLVFVLDFLQSICSSALASHSDLELCPEVRLPLPTLLLRGWAIFAVVCSVFFFGLQKSNINACFLGVF